MKRAADVRYEVERAKERRKLAGLRWIAFLGTLLAFGFLDTVVSLSALRWPGIVRLGVDALGDKPPIAIEAAGLLIVVAMAMYVLSAWVFGTAVAARMALDLGEAFETGGETVYDLFDAALAGAPPASYAALLDEPVRRIDRWRAALRSSGPSQTPLEDGLLTAQPRDLLDHSQSIDFVGRIVWQGHEEATEWITLLEVWAERVALAGLFGTVLSLLVAGTDLSQPPTVAFALRAGLLKASLGFGTKWVALFAASHLTAAIRRRESNLARQASRAWRGSGEGATRGSVR